MNCGVSIVLQLLCFWSSDCCAASDIWVFSTFSCDVTKDFEIWSSISLLCLISVLKMMFNSTLSEWLLVDLTSCLKQ